MRPVNRIAECVALLAALIAILSMLGEWLEPADFLNQFAVAWFVAGSAAAPIALVTGPARAKIAGSAWLILTLVGARMLLADPGPGALADAPAGATVKLVQFNLWKDNPDPGAAAAWLKAQHADVLVLEEAIGRGRGVPWLLRREFPFQQSCVDRGPCSTILLARRRPIASGGLAAADPENRRGLSAAWMRLAGRCGAFTVVGVHLSRPWPWPGQAADRAQLLTILRRQPRSRLIVAGDFNSGAATFATRRFDAQLGTRRATGLLPTWPSPAGYGGLPLPAVIAIDQIHAGPAWRVARLARGAASGSDHFPVVAMLYDASCAAPGG